MKKNYKVLFRAAAVVMASVLFLNVAVSAASFSDVPTSHWAYSSISSMADLGIIVGDSSGRYNPNQVLDKFYASRAMAKAAGYKAVGYTAAEKTYQDNAYEANKSTLNVFKNTFSKWDSSAEREIAFLLEKQVLTVQDLNTFVIVQQNGTETVRALTKEDASLFLVRLMNKNQDALSQNPVNWKLFSDDAQIGAAVKPFVYYMRQAGLVSGDSNNRFNPKQEVTKAVFATMLNSAYTTMNGAAGSAGTAGNTIEAVSGTILEIYPQRSAIQIEKANGTKTINNIALGTTITVDGFVKTFADLTSGMSFSAVLVNDELTNFKATTTPSVTTTTTATPVPVSVSTIEGTVSHTAQDSAARTISIDVRMLNAVGTVYNETRVFKLSSDCKITRGGSTVVFSTIVPGDIVSAQVSGNTVYSVDAQQAIMNFSGVLLEKRRNEITNVNYYVIEDLNGNPTELIVNDSTSIERAPAEYGLKWNDLKLGDKVDVKTSYNSITYIRGEGNRTNVEGHVREIHIYEDNQATIIFKNSANNETTEYGMASNVVDVYSMRVGDKLRLRLDSWEVDSFTKLENALTQSTTGKISSLRNQSFTVTPTGQNTSIQIAFNNDTYVYDAISRKAVSPSAMLQNMEVFVTYHQGTTNQASSITILSR